MKYQELDLVVLKHILNSKKNALDFVSGCDEKLFHTDAWRFTKVIIDYIRVYKEIPTRKVITERIRGQKNEHLLKYINQVWDDVDKVQINEVEYKHQLEKLKNRFTEQLIYDLKDHLVTEDGRIDLNKSVAELKATVNHIKGINQVKAYEQKTLRESLSDIRNRYMNKQLNANFGAGLKTGIHFFDFLTGGIREAECLIVVGPTGGGKSILLNQIALNMWMGENTIDTVDNFKEGCDVLYFSLEMPMSDCLERICANLAKVPQVGIRDATLNDEQKVRMATVLKFIERYPYELSIIDAPRGLTPEALELLYNEYVEKHNGKKPRVVVIDYLALMESGEKNVDDWLRQGHLSESIVELGRVNNINIITAAQMTSVDPNKKENTIGTHRMSRSKMIGHNVNFMLMIEQRPNEKIHPDFKLHLVKSRRTSLGQGTLFKNLECCALLNQPMESTTDAPVDDDISDRIE